MTADFLSETTKARTQNIFKVLKKRTVNSGLQRKYPLEMKAKYRQPQMKEDSLSLADLVNRKC